MPYEVLDRSNLREERFILAYGLRGYSLSFRVGTVGEAHCSKSMRWLLVTEGNEEMEKDWPELGPGYNGGLCYPVLLSLRRPTS